jgi:hypothetical protein
MHGNFQKFFNKAFTVQTASSLGTHTYIPFYGRTELWCHHVSDCLDVCMSVFKTNSDKLMDICET